MKAWKRMTNEIPIRCRRGSACRLEKSMAWDLQLAACRAGKLARNARPTRSQPGAPNQTKTGIVEAPDPREDPDSLAKQWGRSRCETAPGAATSPAGEGTAAPASERVLRSHREEAAHRAGLMPGLVVVDAVRDHEVRIEGRLAIEEVLDR